MSDEEIMNEGFAEQDRRRARAQYELVLALDLNGLPSPVAAFNALEVVVSALNPGQWEDAATYERWLLVVSQLARRMNALNPGVRWRAEFGPDGVAVGPVPKPVWGMFVAENGIRRGFLDTWEGRDVGRVCDGE